MAGDTPELNLEQPPQDPSTKKLSDCLRRIGDELDSNMELQRLGPGTWDHPGLSCRLRHWALVLPWEQVSSTQLSYCWV